MSSSHIIVVARNTDTGEVELPLGDMTLYGVGGEESVLQTCRGNYGKQWVLSLYVPAGGQWVGTKK